MQQLPLRRCPKLKPQLLTWPDGAIENLLSQWDATSEVERASSTATANLVLTGESIIANERLAWTSTATARDEGAKETEKPPEVAEPGAGGARGRGKARVGPSDA